MAPDDTTHFGFETVPLGEKQARVNEVFHSVARRYDLMNDLMSAGLHRLWKEALVTAVAPSKTRPHRHLDVAGGTGDVAFRVLDADRMQLMLRSTWPWFICRVEHCGIFRSDVIHHI